MPNIFDRQQGTQQTPDLEQLTTGYVHSTSPTMFVPMCMHAIEQLITTRTFVQANTDQRPGPSCKYGTYHVGHLTTRRLATL